MLKPPRAIEFSTTVAMNSAALEKRARGERIFNLSAGEPILPPHPLVVKAAVAALKQGKTLYPPVAGIMELRRAAAEWINSTYDTRYQARQTLVTCGGKFGIFAFFQAYLKPGDEVVMLAPYWGSYPQIVKLFGGVPRVVSTMATTGWKVQLKQLEQLARPKARMLILNNAANPTGVLYSREEIKSILAWAKKNNIVVISDEVYSGLVYDGGEYASGGSFPEYRDNVIIIQSCSKHFAMTGWRVGFVFAPEAIIKVLAMLQSQSTTGTSSISQWAAVAAFQNAAEIIAPVRNAMEQRRDVLIETLEKLFGRAIAKPTSSLYAFVSLPDLGVKNNDSVTFCQELIDQYNIAAVPGRAFGAEGYVRLSFGAPEIELVAAITALRGAISSF